MTSLRKFVGRLVVGGALVLPTLPALPACSAVPKNVPQLEDAFDRANRALEKADELVGEAADAVHAGFPDAQEKLAAVEEALKHVEEARAALREVREGDYVKLVKLASELRAVETILREDLGMQTDELLQLLEGLA